MAASAVVEAAQQRNVGGGDSAPVQCWWKLGSGTEAAEALAAVVAAQSVEAVHSVTVTAQRKWHCLWWWQQRDSAVEFHLFGLVLASC